MADEEAKCAMEEEGPGRGVSLKGIKPVIKSVIRDGEINHQRTSQVYKGKSKTKDKTITNRSDQVLLARLRTGHHFGSKEYQNRVNPNEKPTCSKCKELAKTGTVQQQPLDLDNAEHLLDCAATFFLLLSISINFCCICFAFVFLFFFCIFFIFLQLFAVF